MRVFLKGLSLLCMCAVLMGSAHLSFADEYLQVEARFTEREGYSGIKQVPGMGEMRYYAQNDPLWALLCYEKNNVPKRRPFRDSGCNPTALAMAIAYLVPEDEIPAISSIAKKNFSLCACSLNKIRCIQGHTRYEITSQRDYIRFLPLLLGDYATGNNIYNRYSRGEGAGTGTEYFKEISALYGLKMSTAVQLIDAVYAMDQGAAVIAMAAAGGAFTDTGHYVMLAGKDEDRLYILDPLCRSEYKTKHGSSIEIIEPGLVAIRDENIGHAFFSSFYIFHRD